MAMIIIYTHGKGYTIFHVDIVRTGGVMQLQKIVTDGKLAQ
jgi:hypothetical protein